MASREVTPTSVVDWLLDGQEPAVRMFALTDLLDAAPDDERVVEARRAVMTRGAVPQLLALQTAEGAWNDPARFYHDKYRGTVWQLIVLAEHAPDSSDPRVRQACEFILTHSQDPESGGFSMHSRARGGGGLHGEVLPCLTGNMVYSLLRLRGAHDARVQAGVDWITTYQRFDDGETAPPAGWPYDRATACFGRHVCHMGVAKGLKALAEIPAGDRGAAVAATISDAVEYLLRHHVFKRSHDLASVSKPGWKRFGFPLMYQTDVLEILDVLTRLGIRDERMEEAVELTVGKRCADGRWLLDATFNGKTLLDIEVKGQPSRWITLRALRVLKRWNG